MNKKILLSTLIFLIFLIFLILYGGKQAIKSKTGDTIYDKIAQTVPESIKLNIKQTFFKSESLKQEMYLKDKLINELKKKENKKNNIILDIHKKIYFKKVYNDQYKIRDNLLNYSFFQTLFLSNPKNEYAIASGYLDIFEDKLIVATGDGLFLKIELTNLINNNEFFAEKIQSNFKKIITSKEIFQKSYFGIKDVLIKNNKLFVSFTNEVKKDCFNTGLMVAELNSLEEFKFKRINYSDECADREKMDVSHGGGRIVSFSKDEILLTSGDYYQEQKVQNLKSIFGKILKINFNTEKYKIISYGHRNPQGLKYLKDKKIVISTEHGPIGGDEINVINLDTDVSDRNYGWPIASYGVGQQTNPSSILDYEKKYNSHDNFTEPLKQYTPSIGISEIISIPTDFINYNENEKFFVSSLGLNLNEGDLSLHYIETNDKYNKVLKSQIIPFQERIRDIIYSSKLNCFILFLESDRLFKGGPSISSLCKK